MKNWASYSTKHKTNWILKDYLIFWDGEADQTWEPADNLAGSEQLIKEFEASEEVSDDDVKLCDECQRIFISDASLQRHMKDVHDKVRDSKDSETKTTKIVDIAKFVSSL